MQSWNISVFLIMTASVKCTSILWYNERLVNYLLDLFAHPCIFLTLQLILVLFRSRISVYAANCDKINPWLLLSFVNHEEGKCWMSFVLLDDIKVKVATCEVAYYTP